MEQTTTPQPTGRKVWIAFLLSLLLPGLGQIYNGQLKKGILFFVLLQLVPTLFGIFRITTILAGLISLFVIEVGLRIYTIIDAIQQAKKQKEYNLKSYNTPYHYLFFAGAMLVVFYNYKITDFLGTQTFKIPTVSNNPTLQVGDWLVADMKAYREHEPDYGDMVVYSRPDGYPYVFRVVGRPLDTIELTNNIVTINGVKSKATFLQETTSDGIPVWEYEEQLPNGHTHLIYVFTQTYDSTKANIKNIIVPANSYFVLGDNRDNAADSRYEGFISRDQIQGQIIYNYWGPQKLNIDFRTR